MVTLAPMLTCHRVLAVDDDPVVLDLIVRVLTDAGFDVTCHDNLGAARGALMSGSFDLVLTDLYLGEDALGYEVAEIAKAMRPPVPVILVTGRPSLPSATEAIRSCVLDYVQKPVGPTDLVERCRQVVDQVRIRRRNEELEIDNRTLAGVVPRAIEAKDPMTKGHSERVVLYADTLARRCKLDEDVRADLRLAALLHDVGKIGIPDSILRKDGPLTSAERSEIERHPQIGHEILAPLTHRERVRLWVYQHHERWDGHGYPERLVGDEVELPGRILILAEVYDALVSARSYKPAWPIDRIVGFFRDQAGKHFDPDLARMVADGLEQRGPRFFADDGYLC